MSATGSARHQLSNSLEDLPLEIREAGLWCELVILVAGNAVIVPQTLQRNGAGTAKPAKCPMFTFSHFRYGAGAC